MSSPESQRMTQMFRQAQMAGRTDVCMQLLQRCADLTLTPAGIDDGFTPLGQCCSSGNAELATHLLDYGLEADAAGRITTPRVRVRHPMSCLYLACGNGHTAVVKLLLERGATIKPEAKYPDEVMVTPDGVRSCVAIAAGSGHLDTLSLLLDHDAARALVHEPGPNGLYPLHNIALSPESDRTERGLKLLVEKAGADVNVTAAVDESPNFARTPLHVAAQQGRKRIVEALLAYGADACKVDAVDASPMLLAAANNAVEIVKVLLEQPDPMLDAPDMQGWLPLHHACARGYDDVLSVLLEKPLGRKMVNVRLPDNGAGAMHLAADGGHVNVIDVLLENGGQAGLLDARGQTAAACARRRKHLAATFALEQQEGQIEWKYYVAYVAVVCAVLAALFLGAGGASARRAAAAAHAHDGAAGAGAEPPPASDRWQDRRPKDPEASGKAAAFDAYERDVNVHTAALERFCADEDLVKPCVFSIPQILDRLLDTSDPALSRERMEHFYDMIKEEYKVPVEGA